MPNSPFGTAINPGMIQEPGQYGSVFPHAGMTIQQLVAAAMGQEGYRREQQQQYADSMSASPGQLQGLLRGGVDPGMAQAASGMQMQAQQGPMQQGSDPMLDTLAASGFQRQSDFQVNEAIMEYLKANEPSFWDQYGGVLLTLGGMATGGLAAGPIAAGGMGAGAGAGLGATAGSTLAQLINSRY